MCESPELVNDEIPQKHDAGSKYLHKHVIDIGIFNTDIHDEAIDACTDGSNNEKFYYDHIKYEVEKYLQEGLREYQKEGLKLF